jgi:hypothetical protein
MTAIACPLVQDIGGRLNLTSNTNGTHLISMITLRNATPEQQAIYNVAI